MPTMARSAGISTPSLPTTPRRRVSPVKDGTPVLHRISTPASRCTRAMNSDRSGASTRAMTWSASSTTVTFRPWVTATAATSRPM